MKERKWNSCSICIWDKFYFLNQSLSKISFFFLQIAKLLHCKTNFTKILKIDFRVIFEIFNYFLMVFEKTFIYFCFAIVSAFSYFVPFFLFLVFVSLFLTMKMKSTSNFVVSMTTLKKRYYNNFLIITFDDDDDPLKTLIQNNNWVNFIFYFALWSFCQPKKFKENEIHNLLIE